MRNLSKSHLQSIRSTISFEINLIECELNALKPIRSDLFDQSDVEDSSTKKFHDGAKMVSNRIDALIRKRDKKIELLYAIKYAIEQSNVKRHWYTPFVNFFFDVAEILGSRDD